MGIGSGGAGHLLQFQCTNIVQVISIPQKPMSDLLMVMKIQDAAKVSKWDPIILMGGWVSGYGGGRDSVFPLLMNTSTSSNQRG